MRALGLFAISLALSACGRASITEREHGGRPYDSGPFVPFPYGDDASSDPDGRPRPDGRRDGGPRPDGGPLDGGRRDGGPRPDGGRLDGGPRPDGGRLDGGPVPDATPPFDAGPPACVIDDDCGRGQRCHPALGQCVECLGDDDCGFRRVCDPNAFVCLFRCLNGNCGPGAVCDPALDACVDCLDDSQCPNGEHCSPSRTCETCLSDAHCTSPSRPLCDPSRLECVGCRDASDCPQGELCDPGLGVCVRPAARDLCDPCTDDDQCGGPDDLCVGLIDAAGMSFIDRACGIDCANLSCPSGFECLDVRNGTARQCRPGYAMRNPTCTAVRNLGSSCEYSPNALDPGCGIPNLQDARCVPTAGGGVCTVWCADDTDCPSGTSCVVAGDTGVCL
ncbi:MAG: hypothetical protein HY791_16050 [Deltaproteobacteria bacterium]|nr:hypothetical protein [Deltaproteobacteria bacterium]